MLGLPVLTARSKRTRFKLKENTYTVKYKTNKLTQTLHIRSVAVRRDQFDSLRETPFYYRHKPNAKPREVRTFVTQKPKAGVQKSYVLRVLAIILKHLDQSYQWKYIL